MPRTFHLGGPSLATAASTFSLGGRGSTAAVLTPTQALVQSLLAYSPSLLLLGDVGTLQGNGTAAAAGDPLTAAVATWQDQSGHGNDATQTTVMAQPKFVANAYGSRASVRFDGLDDTLSNAAVFNAGYVTIVATHPSATFQHYDTLFTAIAPDAPYMMGNSEGASDTWYPTGVPSVNGPTVYTYNPVLPLTAPTLLTASLNAGGFTGLFLASRPSQGGRNWPGDVLAVLLYSGAANVAPVQTLLANYYGITLTP